MWYRPDSASAWSRSMTESASHYRNPRALLSSPLLSLVSRSFGISSQPSANRRSKPPRSLGTLRLTPDTMPGLSPLLPLHLILFLAIVNRTSATCYDRSGNVLPGASFLPCDTKSTYSACCLLNQGDGGPGDFCTSAGLCLRQDAAPGFFYVDGCTDKSWQSASCSKLCAGSM